MQFILFIYLLHRSIIYIYINKYNKKICYIFGGLYFILFFYKSKYIYIYL